MKTLYDLLGALPDDDADELRAAFRKAAKANHPDNNPDNPEAAEKFRKIVRAHAILSDGQQRAAYDRLRALGVEFTQEPVERYGNVDAGFRDPAGNGWKMIQAAGSQK